MVYLIERSLLITVARPLLRRSVTVVVGVLNSVHKHANEVVQIAWSENRLHETQPRAVGAEHRPAEPDEFGEARVDYALRWLHSPR